MNKPTLVIQNLPAPDPEDEDGIKFPARLRVVKEGKKTRVYCAVTGRKVLGITDVKLDMSDGKLGLTKLTFSCHVVEVVIKDPQLPLPLGGKP